MLVNLIDRTTGNVHFASFRNRQKLITYLDQHPNAAPLSITIMGESND
jgi:hypothetical protein